jgi:polyisoprenoid-binding protein YceI
MKHTTRVAAVLAVGLLAAGMLFGDTYKLDAAHTEIQFKVKHLGISTVTGKFKEFEGSFDFDPNNLTSLKTKATIKTASIDTANSVRDDHLRSPDFFDAESYPEIKFESTKVEDLGGQKMRVHGELTMRGVTKPIVLEGEFTGAAEFMGTNRAGFTARGKINRKDFGVSWSKLLDSGGLVVSDEVVIVLEIQGASKAETE